MIVMKTKFLTSAAAMLINIAATQHGALASVVMPRSDAGQTARSAQSEAAARQVPPKPTYSVETGRYVTYPDPGWIGGSDGSAGN
jgi:hypothetical protein